MTYEELLAAARPRMGSCCKACPVCDGRACGNRIPGPGAKGYGDTAVRNFEAWKKIRLRLDSITEGGAMDTEFTFLGRKFSLPVFAGPVGAVNLHYGSDYNDVSYNAVLVKAAAEAGGAAFTGDGVDPAVMQAAVEAIGANGGCGIPTMKPWDTKTIMEKLALARACGAFAAAMDVDAAGLPLLQNRTPPAGVKTEEELAEIIKAAGMPFIVKGIMTAAGAEKAMRAGACAIVVSNHGGRTLDGCAATAEVLPEVVAAVSGQVPVLVDGGLRDGVDVFRALALGASGVLIARPFVTAVYGGGEAGVRAYYEKLRGELENAMRLTGAHSLKEITSEKVSVF